MSKFLFWKKALPKVVPNALETFRMRSHAFLKILLFGNSRRVKQPKARKIADTRSTES